MTVFGVGFWCCDGVWCLVLMFGISVGVGVGGVMVL